ncbi:alpha/beta fold hydrolase [Streptomyces sp. AP-93]|uniref:alpha/beta fold hydrolase n=1 Tax=Streptomyces sp. AP-93 TaxID=2929048 RepID=UPI0035B4A6F3
MPVLLSRGSESPAWFSRVLDRLAAAMPQARRQTIEGAGHIPHITHPQEYVAALTGFASGA